MAEPIDVQHLVNQLMASASPEENNALLDALMSGQVTSTLDKLDRDRAPTLLPIRAKPAVPGGLDLHGAKPPICRRLGLLDDLPCRGCMNCPRARWPLIHFAEGHSGQDE